MAQGKQTPRQKMINLMYLVFIAMMAMNIDQEIIRSYYESTQSLNQTRLLTENKNTQIFEQTLEAKAAAVPDTYATPWAQYQEMKTKIDDLVAHAEGIKSKLKKDSEFFDIDPDTKNLEILVKISLLLIVMKQQLLISLRMVMKMQNLITLKNLKKGLMM